MQHVWSLMDMDKTPTPEVKQHWTSMYSMALFRRDPSVMILTTRHALLHIQDFNPFNGVFTSYADGMGF